VHGSGHFAYRFEMEQSVCHGATLRASCRRRLNWLSQKALVSEQTPIESGHAAYVGTPALDNHAQRRGPVAPDSDTAGAANGERRKHRTGYHSIPGQTGAKGY
jgi:hypothetical protein